MNFFCLVFCFSTLTHSSGKYTIILSNKLFCLSETVSNKWIYCKNWKQTMNNLTTKCQIFKSRLSKSKDIKLKYYLCKSESHPHVLSEYLSLKGISSWKLYVNPTCSIFAFTGISALSLIEDQIKHNYKKSATSSLMQHAICKVTKVI